MTDRLIEAKAMCANLADLMDRDAPFMDMRKTVISVSAPGFRILYVPDGCEANATMELNG